MSKPLTDEQLHKAIAASERRIKELRTTMTRQYKELYANDVAALENQIQSEISQIAHNKKVLKKRVERG